MNIETEQESLLRQFGSNLSRAPNGWIRSSCPFAPWTHRSGKDSKPSFAMKLGVDGGYRCLSCGEKGGSYMFAKRLEELSGQPMDALKRALQEDSHNNLTSRLNHAMRKAPVLKRVAGITVGSGLAPDHLEEPIPEDDLSHFGPVDQYDHIRKYLAERKVSLDTAEKWELGYHEDSGRLTIPVRDCDGNLRCISGRKLGGDGPPYLHSKGFQRAFYLYGEDHLEVAYKRTGILVEGQFDVLRLASMGYVNPVGSLGTAVTEFQQEKLCQFFSKLVIFFDGDEPGLEAASKVYKELSPRLPCFLVTDPDNGDPGSAKDENIEKLLGPPPGPFSFDSQVAAC